MCLHTQPDGMAGVTYTDGCAYGRAFLSEGAGARRELSDKLRSDRFRVPPFGSVHPPGGRTPHTPTITRPSGPVLGTRGGARGSGTTPEQSVVVLQPIRLRGSSWGEFRA